MSECNCRQPNASFSKKVPVPGQEYSSQQYHASVEVEISDTGDPGRLREQIHETFALVKQSVEDEIRGAAHEPVRETKAPAIVKGVASSAAKASNKQIRFLTDLAGRKGISPAQLIEEVRRQYAVESLYDLDRKQASNLLDSLQERRLAA